MYAVQAAGAWAAMVELEYPDLSSQYFDDGDCRQESSTGSPILWK